MEEKEKKKRAPISEVRKENERLVKENEKLKHGAYCYMCDTIKRKEAFYVSTDPRIKSGITPICKQCAQKIAERMDANGDLHEPTKESVKLALRYLDKPFLESVWNASIQESNNLASGKIRSNVWRSYIKNISMGQYVSMTYADSDDFREHIKYDDEKSEKELIEEHQGQDSYDSFIKNRDDVVRLLDYDPFEAESPVDQPFLYSQLLGLLDASEDANDDMMRISAAITIVRGFLQISKIDNTLVGLMSNINEIADNSATIKSLQDSKAKITSQINSLAAENCLSLKNSKHSKKGENTWTGKIKKISDLNLREGEINGFSIAESKAMQQIQEISDNSIAHQLALDESDLTDIIKSQREDNIKLRKQRDSYEEINRILLRENIDLKDEIQEKGINIQKNLVDLKDIYAPYKDVNSVEYEKDDGGDSGGK